MINTKLMDRIIQCLACILLSSIAIAMIYASINGKLPYSQDKESYDLIYTYTEDREANEDNFLEP